MVGEDLLQGLALLHALGYPLGKLTGSTGRLLPNEGETFLKRHPDPDQCPNLIVEGNELIETDRRGAQWLRSRHSNPHVRAALGLVEKGPGPR